MLQLQEKKQLKHSKRFDHFKVCAHAIWCSFPALHTWMKVRDKTNASFSELRKRTIVKASALIAVKSQKIHFIGSGSIGACKNVDGADQPAVNGRMR